MIIAAAVNVSDIMAVIPDALEEAKGLLFVDTDTGRILSFEEENWIDEIIASNCEVILCGEMRDSELFMAIANACVTRYYAAGLTVEKAILAMDAYKLDIIRDYIGGTGCPGEKQEFGRQCECDTGV